MSYLALAKTLIMRLEACRLKSYQDSVGKWTCGYGSTGDDIGPTTVWTQEVAEHRLDVDLATADRRLRGVLKPAAITGLHEHEMAALDSFVFNLGAGADWTIWKDLNAGDLKDVPAQMRRFDHGMVGGKLTVIPGLDARRSAEVAFWNTADVDQAGAILDAAPVAPPSSSVTRAIATPPEPTPPPPLDKQSVVTKVATLAAGAATALGTFGSQLHDIVAPHASEAPIFNTLAIVASGAVVVAAIVGLLIHAKQAAARAT
jgi:lysozyme